MKRKENAAGREPAAVVKPFVSIPAHVPSVPRNGPGCQARPFLQPNISGEIEPAALADVAYQAQQQAERCKQLAEARAAAGDIEGRWHWLRRRQLHLATVWWASREHQAGRSL